MLLFEHLLSVLCVCVCTCVCVCMWACLCMFMYKREAPSISFSDQCDFCSAQLSPWKPGREQDIEKGLERSQRESRSEGGERQDVKAERKGKRDWERVEERWRVGGRAWNRRRRERWALAVEREQSQQTFMQYHTANLCTAAIPSPGLPILCVRILANVCLWGPCLSKNTVRWICKCMVAGEGWPINTSLSPLLIFFIVNTHPETHTQTNTHSLTWPCPSSLMFYIFLLAAVRTI